MVVEDRTEVLHALYYGRSGKNVSFWVKIFRLKTGKVLFLGSFGYQKLPHTCFSAYIEWNQNQNQWILINF